MNATGPEDDPFMKEQDHVAQLLRFNDPFSTKCQEFVKASSININEIRIVKYNPILLAYFRHKFEPEILDDRDINEIMKYI